MRITKRKLKSNNSVFVGPIVNLLYVRHEMDEYYAFFEEEESLPYSKVMIKLLETNKDYNTKDLECYQYKQTVEEMQTSFVPSITRKNEVHVYYNIEADYKKVATTDTAEPVTKTEETVETLSKKSKLNLSVLDRLLKK